MTSPSEPSTPPAGDPASEVPAPDPTASHEPALPPGANPALPPYAAPYSAWGPPGDPFVPVARAPKTPWVNPAKRGLFLLIAAVLAIVLLGAGFVVGAAAVRHHDRATESGQVERRLPGGPGFGRQGGAPGFGRPGGRAGIPPGLRPGNATSAPSAPSSVVPTPSPSSSR